MPKLSFFEAEMAIEAYKDIITRCLSNHNRGYYSTEELNFTLRSIHLLFLFGIREL
jgi:hypothetical protein